MGPPPVPLLAVIDRGQEGVRYSLFNVGKENGKSASAHGTKMPDNNDLLRQTGQGLYLAHHALDLHPDPHIYNRRQEEIEVRSLRILQLSGE